MGRLRPASQAQTGKSETRDRKGKTLVSGFRRRRRVRFVLAAAVGCLLVGCWKPEKEAPAARGPAAKEFERVFAEFKDHVAEMQVLHAEYREADDARQEEIDKQWAELVKQGDALEPQFIEAAERAFVEEPNADSKVTDLLMDVLEVRLRTDDYEAAAHLGKLLVENKCEDLRSLNFAGIAAFAVGDFDAAENLLKQAHGQSVAIGLKIEALDNLLKWDFLRDTAKYKKAWAEEQKIREAETKAGDLPEVLLKTSQGDIKLVLFENEAPNTVANFISLVDKGFYDGLTFHRVLPAFMAQGGCPKGDGTGGPGYKIACECHEPNHRNHFRGSLSMAHAGRDTGGSQFFITFLPAMSLNGKHTVFGRVVDGSGVLSKLQRRDPKSEQSDRPKPKLPEPDKIIEAKVLNRRGHEYVPEKVVQSEDEQRKLPSPVNLQ